MISYTALAIVSVILTIGLELRVIRSAIFKTSSFYMAYVIVVFFQLLTNGYLTSNHIVQYDPSAIVGIKVVFAPIEDLLFGFSLVTLTMAVWTRLNQEKSAESEKDA